MVLDKGEIQEYDKPSILLSNQDSLYYKMVQESEKTSE